jgi:tetratricopeptide (TPR) repeat protein
MLRLIYFILFSFLVSTAVANMELDELTQRYHAGDTDQKIKLSHHIYFILESYDIDSCYYYISDLQDIGIRESREDVLALSNYFFGHYLMRKSLFNEALTKYESSIKYYKYANNDTLLSEVTNSIGNNYFLQGEMLKAEKYYLQAISIAEKTNDDRFMLIPYPNLARVYMNQGRLEEAEKLLNDYITYYTSVGKLKQLANSISLKGQLYLNKNQPHEAIAYFEQSLEYNLSLGSFRQIANGFTNMAIASFYTEEIDKAEQYFRLAMSYREQDEADYFLAEAYYNMGDFFIETQVYDSAAHYYKKSLDVSLQSANMVGEIDAYRGLSEVASRQGDLKQQVHYLELLIQAKDQQNKERIEQELSVLRASFDAFARETAYFSAIREEELRAKSGGLQGAKEYWIWLMAGAIFSLAGIIIYQRSKRAI